MSQIYVILSSTYESLWDNPVPSSLYDYIYSFANGIKNKKQIQSLTRHHPVLLNAFRFFYGRNLEKCKYAGIKNISIEFMNYYEVKQIVYYENHRCPESIDLHTETWLPDVIDKINEDRKLNSDQKKYFIDESKRFARNKSVIFLDF